jgi:GDSL-like Lipase/Acylhydrolase family
VLHTTFVREAREAGVAGRARCRVLFLGDSITEAFRGTQFGETYDELKPRRKVFDEHFAPFGGRAFGISGDRTQHLLWRIQNGELQFRHSPEVVVICIGTNNLGRDGDGAEDTYLGVLAVVSEVLHRLPGTKILLPGVLPRGPGAADADSAQVHMLPGGVGTSADYQSYTSPPTSGAPTQQNASSKATADASSKFGQPGLFTPTILEVNRRLKAFAAESNGAVTYVECGHMFVDPKSGHIVPALMRDALHPTAKGMLAWFQVLLPAVRQLIAGAKTVETISHAGHAHTHPAMQAVPAPARAKL